MTICISDHTTAVRDPRCLHTFHTSWPLMSCFSTAGWRESYLGFGLHIRTGMSIYGLHIGTGALVDGLNIGTGMSVDGTHINWYWAVA